MSSEPERMQAAVRRRAQSVNRRISLELDFHGGEVAGVDHRYLLRKRHGRGTAQCDRVSPALDADRVVRIAADQTIDKNDPFSPNVT